jgi:hypothetical protein
MLRPPNAVDFWRGFALATIFINHIPGIFYSRFTHAKLSLSDSAEIFVFLAGWALRYTTRSREGQPIYLALRLGGRAIQLYAAHVVITMIAIAMLAASATLLSNPQMLEWHHAGALFQDPVPAHLGLSLLTFQLDFFNILPLYVVLMIAAPMFAGIDRYSPYVLLLLSVALYLVTLSTPIAIPTWPVEGQWFFNPLAWQLVFVLGFVLAREDGAGGFVRRHIVIIRWVSLPIVLIGALVVWNTWWWTDPTAAPEPRLFFVPNKTYVTPMRLVQFLALIALATAAYPAIKRTVPAVVEFLSMLGRHSLVVFCVGSILSLTGYIARFVYEPDLVLDTVIVVSGIAIMALAAQLAEWHQQMRIPSPRPVRSIPPAIPQLERPITLQQLDASQPG